MLAAATRRIPMAVLRSSRIPAASWPSISPDTSGIALRRLKSDLPYHIVVGMPALSPTMEAGTISSWNVGEGDAFAAGDSIAEIQTDKATIDFEAQDDGVVARLLAEAGGGDIKVGEPIMVTVEEPEDVEAFKDFVVEPSAQPAGEEDVKIGEPVTVAVEEPEEKQVVVAPPDEAPVAQAAAAPSPEVKVEVVPPTPPPATPATAAPKQGPAWGNLARVRSPLAKTLSAKQKKYVELYGSAGQIPLK